MKELINNAQHIVIFTHMAPDGDAMGSALAMWHYCQKRATVIVPNAFPAFLGWMPGAEEIRIYEQKPQECDKLIAEADLIICTDFNDPKRIGPMGEKMVANSCPKVLIDHHLMDRCADRAQTANADRPASPDGLWTEVHSHPEASSACEIVYRLIKTAGADRIQTANADRPLTLTEEIATCIYTGLMTDTGNFSYNSNNPEIYEIVASLLRAGARKDDIYDRVFNQYSTDRMRLTGYALYRKMRIFPEHHLALITLTASELEQYHYKQGDCEGLVNMPLQIGDVFYSVFMREERPKPGTPKPRIRISFRSQGDRPVNIWANEVFHGGGHMNASGGELFGSLEQAVKLFENTYKNYLKQ